MAGSGIGWRALALVGAFSLAASAHAGPYHAPRTPWGAPDFQGKWTNFSLTHLERPAGVPAVVGKGDDLAAIEKAVSDGIIPDDGLGGRESEWWPPSHLAVIDGQRRTAWIVSTPDGRIPYTAAGLERRKALRAKAFVDFDGPESRNTSERCLTPTFSALSPPMLNAPYAAGYRIVQTRDAVVIQSEINSDLRIVRLGGRHDAPGGRVWSGDSIGHWEGETLVVDTVGFRPEEAFRAPVFLIGPDAHVVERFTRTGKDEIRYAFTVEDPANYAQAWKGEVVFKPTSDPLYEYACHEGNNSLPGLLQGARYVEAHPEKAGQ
ncbi:MAG: hypothetical protein JSR98_05310 [Proteobacteria bacterium]|nr:hypothetical protein [Pseudomonadota bacterium]